LIVTFGYFCPYAANTALRNGALLVALSIMLNATRSVGIRTPVSGKRTRPTAAVERGATAAVRVVAALGVPPAARDAVAAGAGANVGGATTEARAVVGAGAGLAVDGAVPSPPQAASQPTAPVLRAARRICRRVYAPCCPARDGNVIVLPFSLPCPGYHAPDTVVRRRAYSGDATSAYGSR